ncbi:MAG: hypothetical protein H6Q20_764 [Bacteroidetes bacterium]|jgi:molybdate transport system regulatory protein|nr:hypothetical protein [Bacteroidota bacterium]
MKLSARNQLKGTVKSVKQGAINSEVTLLLPGGSEIVSVITNGAVANLELQEGKTAYAIIKSSSVIIGIDVKQISARNVLAGKVESITQGAINDEVSIALGYDTLTAIITKTSVASLGLSIGSQVSAIIKASAVILAVD